MEHYKIDQHTYSENSRNRDKGTESLYEEIMAENFQNLRTSKKFKEL